MITSNKLKERIEFPVTFILCTLAGLLAFLFVWLVGVLLDTGLGTCVK